MDSWCENEVRLEVMLPLIQEQLESGGTVKFLPKGTSMLPMIRQGVDSVVIAPAAAPLRKFDIPLYRRNSGQFVLHRVVRVGQTYTCIGDNQFVLEEGVRPEQIIGVVTAFYRAGQEVKVSDFRYRLYVLLWHYSRPIRKLWRLALARIKRYTQH